MATTEVKNIVSVLRSLANAELELQANVHVDKARRQRDRLVPLVIAHYTANRGEEQCHKVEEISGEYFCLRCKQHLGFFNTENNLNDPCPGKRFEEVKP